MKKAFKELTQKEQCAKSSEGTEVFLLKRFINKDKLLTSIIFPKLAERLKDNKYIKKIQEISDKIEQKPNNSFQKNISKKVIQNYLNFSKNDLCIKNIDENFFIKNFHLFYVTYLCYEEYQNQTDKFEDTKIADNIIKLYSKANIDIKKSSQLKKYNLLTKTKFHTIHFETDNQYLSDSRIKDIQFEITTPREVTLAIQELLQKGYVTDVSFQIGHISNSNSNFIFEYVDYGKLFDLDNISSLPNTTVLSNPEKSQDKFLVIINKTDIIFEEILENSNDKNGYISTQVVHMQLDSQKKYIIHIDHEYIFYTSDEYEQKEKNITQKGSKKIKTFKIDNAEIPFSFQHKGNFFPVFLLNCYFKNKELIKEYFEKIYADRHPSPLTT